MTLRRLLLTAAIAQVILLATCLGPARAAPPELVQIGTFEFPVHLTSPPGDSRRILVVERAGSVRLLVDGVSRAEPFLTVPDAASLHSLEFAPDYAESGRMYVHLFHVAQDIRVQEWLRSPSDPDKADAASLRELLRVVPPTGLHAGGQLAFGPDGLLYVGIGDGGPQGDPNNHAQRLDTLLGKILRVSPLASGDMPYGIPSTNPFVGADGFDEIFSYGVRNPWRFQFDGAGAIYLADPGDQSVEEINYVSAGGAAGGNFGWSCYEGSQVFNPALSCPGAIFPVHTYGNAADACGGAVIGGGVVRDTELPQLLGRYLYGDYCNGELRSFRICDGRAVDDRALGVRVNFLTSFGTDADGRVYALSQDGPVYRLAVGPAPDSAGACPAPPSDSAPAASDSAPAPPHPDANVTQPPAIVDREPPAVELGGASTVKLRRTLPIAVRCLEPCSLRASGRVSIVRRKPALRVTAPRARSAGYRLRPVSRSLPAGGRTTMRLALSLQDRRALRRALRRGRTLRALVLITARDQAGNTRTLRHTVAVRG